MSNAETIIDDPPITELRPNQSDISAHLYALFPHSLVAPFPDCWIEIATASAKTDWQPKSAKHFSPFDLKKAVDYAVAANKSGVNVYVGPSLRTGNTGPSGRSTDANYLATGLAWSDIDADGEFKRISDVLESKGLQNAMLVMTGHTPHKRAHIYFRLTGTITAAEIKAVNIALKTLLGTDNVEDPCRLMRLAGSVSYPSDDKVTRGYTVELVTLHVRKDAQAYSVEEILKLAGASLNGADPFHHRDGKDDKKPRTDDEIIELLERSKLKGQWHNAIRNAIATMVGRGWDDLQIKLAVAPYCTGKYKDKDLTPLIAGARKKWNKPDPKAAKLDSKAEIERLAKLSLLDYNQARGNSATALGIRVTVLDGLVQTERDRLHEAKAGPKPDIEPEIVNLNIKHAVVLAGGKASIMRFDTKTSFKLLQVEGFKLWFANRSMMVGKTMMPIADYWLSHPKRRQYSGIEFAPPGSHTQHGFYNLWQGLTCEPEFNAGVAGWGCRKFLGHIYHNVARGDLQTYLWIVAWWAQIFQQPSVKMETALVVRGAFGTGKTKLGTVMGSLLGDHYLLVSHPRYITGQFNSHMASLLVLHADEAFWAGSKESVGVLRDLVTGTETMLEYKRVDAIRIKNYMRFYVSGNPDWMISAGFKERRWAVFDMGEGNMQDHSFFAAVDEEMNNGGREALLNYLLTFDLSTVDLRKIPMTATLLDQQIESMTPEQAWWFDTLMAGKLPPAPAGTGITNTCLREDLYRAYIHHARQQGTNHRAIATKIGMFLAAQLKPYKIEKRPTVGTDRPHCYGLPSLRICRELFAELVGQPINWGFNWEKEEWTPVEIDQGLPVEAVWDPAGYWAKKG